MLFRKYQKLLLTLSLSGSKMTNEYEDGTLLNKLKTKGLPLKYVQAIPNFVQSFREPETEALKKLFSGVPNHFGLSLV